MVWSAIVCGWLGLASGQGRLQSDAALDDYMRRLAIAGNVQTENGPIQSPGIDANTRFDLDLHVRWNWEIEVAKSESGLVLRVTPELISIEARIRHRLRLPKVDPSHDRFRTLLLHEYDHVAISADERPILLLKHLLKSIGTLSEPWKGAIPPPDRDVNDLIAREIERRKAAVLDLVNFAYSRLDQLTDHGRKAMPSRESFAEWLYSGPHLKEAQFAFPKEAANALEAGLHKKGRAWFRAG